MKRVSGLYNKILDKEYIKEIIVLASKGKTKRGAVRRVLENIDHYTDVIYEMVKNSAYELKPTHNKTIVENGKKRELTISPFFPNRVLDYLMVETLKPVIRKSMYYYCIGNVDKKGMMFGKDYIARNHKKY